MSQPEKLHFPQHFDIKVIIETSIPIEESKRNLCQVFCECQVVHSFVNVRASTKGNYMSYCYSIEVNSEEQLKNTYQALKHVPGIKFAL